MVVVESRRETLLSGGVTPKGGLSMRNQCTELDCIKDCYRRSWCRMHYKRWIKRGTVVPPYRPPPIERFVAKIDFTDTCWLWMGALTGAGYGSLRAGRNIYAHRFAYEFFVGPIPAGLTIDHLCRVTHCANWEHLEPVTQRENVLRGAGPSAVHARKAHCLRGHPFNEENTLYNSLGHRSCRSCRRARKRTYATQGPQAWSSY